MSLKLSPPKIAGGPKCGSIRFDPRQLRRTRFAHPPSLAKPEYLTLVHIDCFEGRSVDAKRALYCEIVTRLEPLGIPADHVSITVRDIPTSNWGIRGGQAACDVDLGFDVEV